MHFPPFFPLTRRRAFSVKRFKTKPFKPSDLHMSILTQPSHCRAVNHCSSAGRGGRYIIVLILCAACMLQFASHAARAQCTARDVLQSQLRPKLDATQVPQQLIRSVRDAPTWKTITIGTFADTIALRNKLDSMGCNVGGQASEILARPAFTVGSHKTDVDLVVVSPAQLGFAAEAVTLAAVYARARRLGFELAAAEVGPQLRLQYVDQPMGEFLIIGMEPIKTWDGEPVILNVANGGAGLILIGQDGRAEAEIPVTSRFVFARPEETEPRAAAVDQAAAFLPP
jgi:hypothetical protein